MSAAKAKFSRLGYQQELIAKLTAGASVRAEENAYLFVQDKNGKILALPKEKVDFIDDIRFLTFLPPFNDAILAVVNIQEKEVLLIDLDAYLSKESSVYRDSVIPKEYKCLLLKDKKVGLLAKIIPGYIDTKKSTIDIVNVDNVYKLLG